MILKKLIILLYLAVVNLTINPVNYKVRLSPFKKNFLNLLQRKLFKNNRECFIFHAKSYFLSWDVYIFVLKFWFCRKTAWSESYHYFLNLRCHRLDKKSITKYILPNTPRNKGNQTMKFGQLIEYNMKNIFLEISCTKRSGEASPRVFCENQNWTYLWINSLKYHKVYFCCMSKPRSTKIL